MSKVLRPNSRSNGMFICLFMTAPRTSSEYGACHPPYAKPPLVSSSGPPPACMTPSRVTNSRTITFLMTAFLQHLATSQEAAIRRWAFRRAQRHVSFVFYGSSSKTGTIKKIAENRILARGLNSSSHRKTRSNTTATVSELGWGGGRQFRQIGVEDGRDARPQASADPEGIARVDGLP